MWSLYQNQDAVSPLIVLHSVTILNNAHKNSEETAAQSFRSLSEPTHLKKGIRMQT